MAAMLAVMAVNTTLGTIFAAGGILSLIAVIEFKAKVSLDDQTVQAGMNQFQEGLEPKDLIIKKGKNFKHAQSKDRDYLRILCWNIERGYKPEMISDYIEKIDADLVCLQEVDWNNERTNNRDILQEIADSTAMQGLFGIEFFEIQAAHRSRKMAGGGVHGNAILSRLELGDRYRIDLPIIFDWENPSPREKKTAWREKREGGRFALCAELDCAGKKVVICSTHLEDKGGSVDGRVTQVRHLSSQLETKAPDAVHIIAGDLNTADNRLTRLLRLSKPSPSQPRNLSECQWWKQVIVPSIGLFDPFNCRVWTFEAFPFYRSKLDWILLNQELQVERCGIGDFHSSDHRPIWVDIKI